ncbi:hypothetical protein T492DRAFT_831522 [Pavlovales sp. CCMP2436]|nr:hypothetical protein T492DRAFT_831522 [Pavlovales sp. CCMP2436]
MTPPDVGNMQREMAVLMVQRGFRLFEARRHMRAFDRMDRYTEWRVTAWVYSEDGHIEIDMDASMGSLAPPCYIASMTGDAIGGDIRIVYYKRGKHVPIERRILQLGKDGSRFRPCQTRRFRVTRFSKRSRMAEGRAKSDPVRSSHFEPRAAPAPHGGVLSTSTLEVAVRSAVTMASAQLSAWTMGRGVSASALDASAHISTSLAELETMLVLSASAAHDEGASLRSQLDDYNQVTYEVRINRSKVESLTQSLASNLNEHLCGRVAATCLSEL